jgi:hypothetical protein
MQSDILAAQMLTATGNLKTADGANNLAAVRIKGIYYSASVSGTLTFRDGGSGGTIVMTIPVTASASGLLWIPDNGLWFRQGTPHVTVTAATLNGVTVFYA